MSAFETALLRMQADSDAIMAAHERKRRDTRLNYLSELYRKLDKPITGHGFAGFVQVIEATSADSSRNWRLARVKSLMAARRQQLDTDPRSSRFWMAKAAEQHRKELFCRHREQAEQRLAEINNALAIASAELSLLLTYCDADIPVRKHNIERVLAALPAL